jgi:hypothetical protein
MTLIRSAAFCVFIALGILNAQAADSPSKKLDSSWTRWNAAAPVETIDPFAGFKRISHKSALKPAELNDFDLAETDDEVAVVEKLNGLTRVITQDVDQLAQSADIVPAQTEGAMIYAADSAYDISNKIFDDIGYIYDDINSSKTAAARSDKSKMERAMRATDAMAARIQAEQDALDGMLTAADHLALNGQDALKMADQVSINIDAASKKFKTTSDGLDKRFPYAYFPKDLSQSPKIFKDQKDYLNKFKNHIQKNELSKIDSIRKYVSSAKDHLNKTAAAIAQTKNDLSKMRDYLGDDKEPAPEQAEGNICTNAETKGMNTLKECSKSCRTVCRFKDKVNGENCYECPSGSPDSCFDVGAWPANHPWCAPGGICHDDPMLYCSPFGTTGPNKEKLECTNCKQRVDMCATKAGGGMTYTNCKLGCWNGSCEFKGKYQEFEWDGSLEWVHCYECKLPPPPPTCEDLGWGYSTEGDCANMCPAPGQCLKGNIKVPGAPVPPGQDPNGQPGQPGGQQGGGAQAPGNGTQTGKDGEDTDGQDPNPPTGSPQQPGGGGSIAGGKDQGGQTPSGGQTTEKPQAPTTTEPQEPSKPNTPKPQITDPAPPEPPDNQEITWLRTRMKQLDDLIMDREDIINDPREGIETKSEAAHQIEGFNKEYDRLETQLKNEQDRERERLAEEARRKKIIEEGQNRQPTRTRWPDPREEIQKIRLKELKDSVDALNSRVREIKDMLTGQKEHIERLTHEISLTEREIQHHKDSAANGSEDSTQARNTIKRLEDELKHKQWLREQLVKKMQEAQKQYQAEIESLRRAYLQKLYAADENARRTEETKRIDEYYDIVIQGDHTRAAQAERNREYEEILKNTDGKLTPEQLENIRRGQAEWNATYERQIKANDDQLHQYGQRNFQDGAGPSSREHLVEKLNEYGKLLDDKITFATNRIAELELALKEHRIGTSVDRNGKEHVVELDNLRVKLEQLKASREAIAEKQQVMKQGYRLDADIVENIHNSTDSFANGSKNRGEDKSMGRLILESLGEESLHNLRPDVMIKKNVAFAWGIAQGVGTAVKGLAELGVGIVDLSIEMHLTNLGFDIETDKLDMLNNMLSTVGSNANFDGIIKATVALGGAIDAKIRELEKSSDIDWATAEFGGKVAGEVVVADVVIGQALGKAGEMIGLTDKVTDGARAADRVSDAATTTRRSADAAADTRAATHIDDAIPPKTTHVDTPPARDPPVAKPYNNTRALPTNNRPTTQLADDVLDGIETRQGFKKEHAQRMHEFAQETDTYLIVRDGNPDSVKFFDDPDMVPKPMSSKAKTAKVGPDQGLVVNPTNPNQAKYWDEAIAEANRSGNTAEAERLISARKKALKSWDEYGEYMKSHGYTEDPSGRMLLDGKAVHGDYDLHGVYRRGANGKMEHVSFGDGNTMSDGEVLRRQLNNKITGGSKDFVQHGAQDDWIPDPKMVPNKPPDPPVTVFFPDGRPPVHLNDAKAMKNFYEGEMGVKWPYPEPK